VEFVSQVINTIFYNILQYCVMKNNHSLYNISSGAFTFIIQLKYHCKLHVIQNQVLLSLYLLVAVISVCCGLSYISIFCMFASELLGNPSDDKYLFLGVNNYPSLWFMLIIASIMYTRLIMLIFLHCSILYSSILSAFSWKFIFTMHRLHRWRIV